MPVNDPFSPYPTIPWIGPRSRYKIVTDRSPTWVYHQMAPGAALDGTYTQTATQADPTKVDPAVSTSKVVYDQLTHGGLFTAIVDLGREIVIEDLQNPGGAALSTQWQDGTSARPVLDPTKLPIHLAPGETIKAKGGPAGAFVAFLVRYDETTIL